MSSPTTASATPRPMLVCAAAPGQDPALVSLADGVYETSEERVFWRGAPDREVLRLPLELPVSTRPLKDFPRQRSAGVTGGEQALLQAVQGTRCGTGRRPEAPPIAALPLELAVQQAVHACDPDLAFARAVLLWKAAGLGATYAAMSRCLAELGSRWGAGTGTVLTEHRASRTVSQVVDRLAALTPTPARCGTVIMTVPTGEQHTLALTALAHLVRDAGRPVLVVDALPLSELVTLTSAPETSAVLVSVHTTRSEADLRFLVRTLRAAAPHVLLALGGPGLPQRSAALGADLVGDDVSELLTHLDARSCALTDREAQVLTAVADGLTNVEIGQLLGVAPATVKSHLINIFTKTQTEHRAAAVAHALRSGWIT